MNGKRDYYEVLGLDRSASSEELKSLPQSCMKYHPDRNPGMRRQRKNSRKHQKLSKSSVIKGRPEIDQFGHQQRAWAMDSAVLVKVQGLEIFSAISSVTFWGRRRPQRPKVENGALICSTTSRSNLKMQPSAPQGTWHSKNGNLQHLRWFRRAFTKWHRDL